MSTSTPPSPNTSVKTPDTRSAATAYVTKNNIVYQTLSAGESAELGDKLNSHRGTTTTRVAGQHSYDPAA